MRKDQKQNLIKALPVYLFCVICVLALVLVYRRYPPKNPNTPLGESIARYMMKPDPAELTSLHQIAAAATSWHPILTGWFGRPVPDFDFTDIAGTGRKLSDYRGRDVIIVLWATWWPPCKMELPHLISLRSSRSPEDLAIIAISSEDRATVAKFAAENELNYTVAATQTPLPEPFRLAEGIPTSFYLDKEAKLKFATRGLVTAGEAQAIIQAKD